MDAEATKVGLWVDPVCPFAWITSRWLLEVERFRPIDVTFHVMSLSVLNQGRDGLSEFYRDLVDRAWGGVRLAVAVEHHHGTQALRALYGELGQRIHVQGRRQDRAVFVESLAASGLPTALADVADTDEYDEMLRSSHHLGMDPVGEEVGTPVIHVPGVDGEAVALFGPVLTSAPRAEAAVRLWDGVMLAARTPEFFELKRSRTRSLSFE
jgi:hypothetical protein